jgi:hypothetical protein
MTVESFGEQILVIAQSFIRNLLEDWSRSGPPKIVGKEMKDSKCFMDKKTRNHLGIRSLNYLKKGRWLHPNHPPFILS